MPLDKFVLILLTVIVAAGATVWVGAVLAASWQMPGGLLLLIPALLVAYVVWRVVSDRMRSAEDDHYDRIDRR